ncbi:MAG: hypothetical protein ACXABV_04270 [Candidatus Thorarchaeota archaeon]
MYSEFVSFVYEVEIKEYLENTPDAIAIHGVVGATNLTEEALQMASDNGLRRFVLHCELESVLVGLPKRSGLYLEPDTEITVVGIPITPTGFKAYAAFVPSVRQVMSISRRSEWPQIILLSLLLFWILKQIPFDIHMPLFEIGVIELSAIFALVSGFALVIFSLYWQVIRVPYPAVCNSDSWERFQHLISDRFSYVNPEMRELVKSVNAPWSEEE